MNNRLIEASRGGDIDVLYELIEEDPEVLRDIDKIMLVDTPLHIAASVGQTCFAMEIMNLMPSFARKLNNSGLSPMHLAIQKGHLELVLSFVKVDCDLVRVKGKKGLTPLHFAVKYGNIDLLAQFLVVCPQSIEDVTVNGETALHIAVKNDMLEALEVLVGWLQRICRKEALKWKVTIPNRKDLQGKTVLDIAVSKNQLVLIPLLAEINAKHADGNHKIITSKRVQNRQTSSSDQFRETLTNYIRSQLSFEERFAVFINRQKMKISDDARSALLVVLGLIVAATYQAIFNPPGSVRQGQDDDSCDPTTMINGSTCIDTIVASKLSTLPGTAVMNKWMFFLFSFLNSGILHAAVGLTCLLLPYGVLGSALRYLLFCFLFCYFISLLVITPLDERILFVVLSWNAMCPASFGVFTLYETGSIKLRQFCFISY